MSNIKNTEIVSLEQSANSEQANMNLVIKGDASSTIVISYVTAEGKRINSVILRKTKDSGVKFTYNTVLHNDQITNGSIEEVVHAPTPKPNSTVVPQTDITDKPRKRNISPVKRFLSSIKKGTYLLELYKRKIAVKDLYDCFLEWCKDNGYKWSSSQFQFKLAMEKYHSQKSKVMRINNKSKTGFIFDV